MTLFYGLLEYRSSSLSRSILPDCFINHLESGSNEVRAVSLQSPSGKTRFAALGRLLTRIDGNPAPIGFLTLETVTIAHGGSHVVDVLGNAIQRFGFGTKTSKKSVT